MRHVRLAAFRLETRRWVVRLWTRSLSKTFSAVIRSSEGNPGGTSFRKQAQRRAQLLSGSVDQPVPAT